MNTDERILRLKVSMENCSLAWSAMTSVPAAAGNETHRKGGMSQRSRGIKRMNSSPEEIVDEYPSSTRVIRTFPMCGFDLVRRFHGQPT